MCVVLFAVIVASAATPISRTTSRLMLKLWPPSITGSWSNGDISISLVEQNRHITGTGSAGGSTFESGGSAIISIAGDGNGRIADLTVTLKGTEDRTWISHYGATASMPDRATLLIRLGDPTQGTRPFNETTADATVEYLRRYGGKSIEWILKRR